MIPFLNRFVNIGPQLMWQLVAGVAGLLVWATLTSYLVIPNWELLEYATLPLFLVSAFRPQGAWPAVLEILTLWWWWGLGARQPWWLLLLVLVLLAVHRLACSWAAMAPAWAGYAPGLIRTRVLRLLLYVAVCVAVAVGIVFFGAAGRLPLSPLWVVLAVGVVLGAAILVALWFFRVTADHSDL